MPLDPDDADLIASTLQGDRAAFGVLHQRHHKPIFDLTFRMLRNREEAEDVTQQVFIEAFRHLASFRHGAKFSTWLYAIALNRSRNHLRSRKLRQTVPIDSSTSDSDDFLPRQFADSALPPDVVVEQQLDMDWIRAELLLLSKDYQEIFVLHYFQHFPLEHISRQLGKPLGTIKVYLHRARKELLAKAQHQYRLGGSKN